MLCVGAGISTDITKSKAPKETIETRKKEMLKRTTKSLRVGNL